MRIKICHISTVHSLYDDRIFYKECKSLSSNGYEVSLIVQHNQDELIEGIQIIALPDFGNRFSRLLKGNLLALKRAFNTKSAIYHFHDPELMITGLILKLSGKKVVYDVHENISLQILSKEWIEIKFLRRVVSIFIKYFEKFNCLFYDGIITVTDDISIKFNKNKTIILRNFPILKFIKNEKINIIEANNKFKIIYAGGLTRVRGIKEIILAIGLVNDNCELWLLGSFDDTDYYEECRNTKGWEKTKYMGYLRMEDVYGYIEKADIGIAMLYPIGNYLTSLPVKAFEYMAMGKPIIMSDFSYWKTIFEGVALFANPQKSEEIAKAIEILYNDTSKREEMGRLSKQIIQNDYNWEMEQLKLIDLYSKILD
jgi:glycosyltransferase involved in cell wall biosynthesis